MKKIQIEDLDSDFDAEDLVLNSVAQDSVLVLDWGGLDCTTLVINIITPFMHLSLAHIR